MAQQELPTDIVELILKRRSVYVANHQTHDYEFSKFRCLGVFNTLDMAKAAVIRAAFSTPSSSSQRVFVGHFDPAQRFRELPAYALHQRSRSQYVLPPGVTLQDKWTACSPSHSYTIEERQLDCIDSDHCVWYFNYDQFIKTHIVQNNLSSDEVHALFESWFDKPELAVQLMKGEFITTEPPRYKELTDTEAWCNTHSVISFP